MKKGLRPALVAKISQARHSERSPDEEGIKTDGAAVGPRLLEFGEKP